jgi:hypothetical protein
MPVDRTKDNDRFVQILKGRIDQFALSLASSDTKNYIQQLVIEPFLRYILERAFPYLVLGACLFAGILIVGVATLVVLLVAQKPHLCAGCRANLG